MLQILCGPDRTANSMRILDQICENARAGVAGQILIVPEQYSHETERALCARGGDTISRYAEVLSFTRLAARVFSVCGGVCEEYLDENGRVLTLYLAAQQVREQLKFYAAVMTRPDFLRQLGTLMEELLTSCIPPDALHAAAARLEGRLAQKVTELALLYESYLAVCKTGRGDPVTRQMRLRDLLDETDFLDGRTVFLDGFSDFTALQQQILAAILAHAEAVHVSVLTSGGEQAACQTGNETKKRLQQLAAHAAHLFLQQAGRRVQPLGLQAVGADQLRKALALVCGREVHRLLLIQVHLYALTGQPQGRFAARQTGTQNSYFIIAHVVVFSFNPSSAPASQSRSPLWRNRAWSPCGRGWSRTFRTWWPPAYPRS